MSRRRSGYVWACLDDRVWVQLKLMTPVQHARVVRVRRQMARVKRRAARRQP